MMFRDRFAGFAINAVRVQAILEPFEAGRVIRNLLWKSFSVYGSISACGCCGPLVYLLSR